MAARTAPADKMRLVEAVRAELVQALTTMESAAHAAREAAAHPEMRPENDKDTRGLEAGYLATGQSARAAELRKALVAMENFVARAFAADEAVAVGAVVDVEDEDGAVASYFVAPAGGGKKGTCGKRNVNIITPQSPIGDALVGKRKGDSIEVVLGGRARDFVVVGVS